MTNKSIDLYVQVGGGPDADKQDLEELARLLTEELNQLDNVESAEPVREGELPEDAKGVPVAVGTVLVKLAETAGVTALINVIGSWLSRDKSRTLKLQLGESALELTGLSGVEQRELVEWFKTQAGVTPGS
jgi:hypothetical protein